MTCRELLRSRKTEDRIRAVRQLARMNLAEATPGLLIALNDRSGFVAAEAAKALGEGADDAACAQMTARFLELSEDGGRHDPGCHVRAALAFGLGQREYYGAVEALRIGIQTRQIEPVGGVPFDTGAHLRSNCALALAQIRPPDALRAIAPLLFDTGVNGISGAGPALTGEPRKLAAQAIARTGDRNGGILLALKLRFPGNESADVLQECMQALLDLEDPDAEAILIPYLEHRDQGLAAYAALMLARTRSTEAVEAIVESLPRLRGNALEAVLLALVGVRSEQSEAALTWLSREGSREVQRLLKDLWAPSDGSHGC